MSGGELAAAASSRRGFLVGTRSGRTSEALPSENAHRGLRRVQGDGNMQRVVSRHRVRKATQFLKPAARSRFWVRELGLEGRTMDSISVRVLGDAGLRGVIPVVEQGRIGRPIESGTRVSVRPGRRSSSSSSGRRIQSLHVFSAERFLDRAVDVLRNFNKRVNGWRFSWGGQGFSSAAQEKVFPSEGAGEGEVAEPSGGQEAAPPSGEFEWRSALWEAELWSKSDSAPREEHEFGSEAENALEENAERAEQSGIRGSDGVVSAEAEEVDIGELWNSRGRDGSDPQRWNFHQGVVGHSALEGEDAVEHTAVTEPSPATESPRETMEAESVAPSAPDLERTHGHLPIEGRADLGGESLPISDRPSGSSLGEVEDVGRSSDSPTAQNSLPVETQPSVEEPLGQPSGSEEEVEVLGNLEALPALEKRFGSAVSEIEDVTRTFSAQQNSLVGDTRSSFEGTLGYHPDSDASSLPSEERPVDFRGNEQSKIEGSFAHEPVETRPVFSEATAEEEVATAEEEAEDLQLGTSSSPTVSSQEEFEREISSLEELEGDIWRESDMDRAGVAGGNDVLPDLNTSAEHPAAHSSAEMDELRKNIDRLRETLAGQAFLYHSTEEPAVSDATYDSLLEELKRLELQASKSSQKVTSSVGAPVSPGMPKVQHSSPMLSLASTQKEAELRSWFKKLQERLGSDHEPVGWVVEPKVDGLALSLRYEDGKLKYAATRGDGFQGEDVTQNVHKVRGIPLNVAQQFPDMKDLVTSLEVRGEVFMPLESYRDLNHSRVESGLSPLSSPRNAAAGTLRSTSESNDKHLRPLEFMAFSATILSPFPHKEAPKVFQRHWGALQLLGAAGFSVNEANRPFDSFESALDYARRWRSERGDLKYEADGVVFKVDDLAAQASLGNATGEPRWAMAWKFEATEAATVLEGIEINVGRSGVITPIARFKAVELAGAMINRASLHNMGHVKALRLCIGDHIVVQRAGDVIPKVLHALPDLRKEGASPWAPPDQCPTCGSTLEWRTSGMVVMCPNRDCGSRHTRQVAHYAKTLIPWLGPSSLRLLEDSNLLTSPADFYKLDLEKLTKLPGFGKAKAVRILKAIEDSKQQELSSFILAFGIPHVGLNTAKDLAKMFKSIRALQDASVNTLFAVPGVGWGTSQCIYDWCRSAPNVELIHALEAAGCRLNTALQNSGPPSSPAVPAAVETVDDNCDAAGEDKSEGLTETLMYLESPGDAESGTDNGGPASASPSPSHGGATANGHSPANGVADGAERRIGGPSPKRAQEAAPKLAGKIVVVTGDFGPTPRNSVKDLIIRQGGVVRTAITSKTNLLLCGIKPGPAKISEAKQRDIQTMDWHSFLNSIDEESPPPSV